MRPAATTVPRGFWAVCVGVFLVGVGLRFVVAAAVWSPASPDLRTTAASRLVDLLHDERPAPRTSSVYGGLGVWIDAFDFSRAYRADGVPPVTPDVVAELAELGVRTVYLQAARSDERAPGTLLEPDLLGAFLLRAHAHGLRVVGWYLPTFEDVDTDLEHLEAIAEFNALGHRFDGVAVDIEYLRGVPDPVARSARLVELSTRLRGARPGEAIGAIVPPPVQMEVVNPDFWPDFPWRQIEGAYDVWMPMAYWTTRSGTYRDPYAYTEESTRRLRNNLGRADAVVHPVGGIGDATTVEDLATYRRALRDTGAIGGSLYDWHSLPLSQRALLPRLLPDG